MKFLDRVLQRWRIAQARPFIRSGARVLDIGSADGKLFEVLDGVVRDGVGIDSTVTAVTTIGSAKLIPGLFPQDMPDVEPFDVITMLAVLEHFPPSEYADLKEGCLRFLNPGGCVVITVPSPKVDHILRVLTACRLIHGMSLEQHHGYDVEQTTEIFSAPEFELVKRTRFQLGLNNLFVLRRNGPGVR